MDVSKIIAEIDSKIATLQHARSVILNLNDTTPDSKPRRGRPKGKANAPKVTSIKVQPASPRKHNITPEGRRAIAEAMKRRWAERRTQTSESSKKASAKKQP